MAASSPDNRRPTRAAVTWAHRLVAAGVVLGACVGVSPTSVAAEAAPGPLDPVSSAADREKHYVVRETPSGAPETLFRIAQRVLGSGQRFREIFELNRGRVQPDGSRVTDPEVVAPGWILQLPQDARGAGVQRGSTEEAVVDATRAASAATTPPEDPSASETAPGEDSTYYVVSPAEDAPDSLFEIAEQFLGSGDRSPEIFELNVGREQPGGRVVRDPDEIRDGWLLELPTDAQGDGVQTGPLPTLDELNAPDAPQAPGAADSASDSSGSLAWWLLAGGVVSTLSALAAWFLLRRRPSRDGRGDASTSAGSRRRLRLSRPWRASVAAAGPDGDAGIWTVDRALRVLAASCSASGRPVPGLYVVVVDGETIRLRLTGPDPSPPEGWTTADGARTWSAPLHVLQAAAVDTGGPAPFPHLVSVGDSEHGRVLLDLARAQGVISLEGDPAAAVAVADGWCTELASAPWSGEVSVVRVGPRGEDPPPARSRSDDLDRAEAAIAEFGGGVLVISGSSRADVARIADLAADPHHTWTVVAVDGATAPARWRLKVDGGGRVHGGPLDVPVRSRVRIKDLKAT